MKILVLEILGSLHMQLQLYVLSIIHCSGSRHISDNNNSSCYCYNPMLAFSITILYTGMLHVYVAITT